VFVSVRVRVRLCVCVCVCTFASSRVRICSVLLYVYVQERVYEVFQYTGIKVDQAAPGVSGFFRTAAIEANLRAIT